MEVVEHSLLILGIVLLVGLLAPEFLRRFRIPFASSLILVGALLGPHGLDRIELDPTLTLFGFLGATFQMLLAGFEAQALDLRPFERHNLILYTGTGVLPALLGGGLALALGLSWTGALLIACVFMSSSILLVFSFAEHLGFGSLTLGQRLKSATVLEELSAVLMAFALLHTVQPHPRFSLPILIGLVISSVVFLRLFVPEIVGYAFSRFSEKATAESERRVRFTLALLLIVLFLFSGLDVPPTIAAFLVGFSLAGIDEADAVREKLQLVGHALFIPVFLFVVGLEVDFRILFRPDVRSLAVLGFIVLAISSKLLGGYLATGLLTFERRDRLIFGLTSTAKLTIPVTTAYAALKAGIIESDLFAATVIVSILTSVFVPIALGLVYRASPASADA